MRLMDGLRLAVGTLTVFPVRVERVDRDVAGRAMTLAPAVGLVLGAVAGVALLLPGPPLLGAALALGALAVLTRGLHLDGLADLADGLGSGKPAGQALDIMKKSDIGPFGVMALVLTLLVQAAALTEAGFGGLVTACVAGRLALTWACRAGVPAARPDGLGAMVAGTVRRAAAWAATLAALCATTALGLLTPLPTSAIAQDGTPGGTEYDAILTYIEQTGLHGGIEQALHSAIVLPLGLVAGLGAALLLLRHARRRLGGITGDVLGALVETATATTLVVCAILS
ncbi:adenosylcobinamide-GDP ribazoletransferase [Nonomuraea maritima]|uniref:Adenosylcobinamide-GDP ribazoletransferase n=1 Tax=Nonomuraea maritima TaxID=683260 RepID=A0A1G8RRV5_9ACTN|nr:adenosylcobinamide-GDP ribazoletransferase [Nonomuraea maritima]SDJ19698.1 adenosylcobinamide-GDP ribazoletransferase [Nonomuraea maritima]